MKLEQCKGIWINKKANEESEFPMVIIKWLKYIINI